MGAEDIVLHVRKRGYDETVLAEGSGEFLNHRLHVQMGVRDVERQYAAGLQVAKIQLQRLLRDEVHGKGVAGEGVDDEEIVLLVRLTLEREPSVAQNNVHGPAAVREVGELASGKLLHEGIDLVEAKHIARPRIPGEAPCSQADDANAQSRRRVAKMLFREVNAGVGSVVRYRRAAAVYWMPCVTVP